MMATTSLARIPDVFRQLSTCELFPIKFINYLDRVTESSLLTRMSTAIHLIFHSSTCYRSRSMARADRKPLPNAAATPRITATANNRLGAVLSSLYSFWTARQAAAGHNAQLGGHRRDAYSIIFFSREPLICVENDFTSSPDELLTSCLRYKPFENENYTHAIEKAQSIMTSHWSTER